MSEQPAPPTGEVNLRTLLRSLRPVLHPQTYVFCTVSPDDPRIATTRPIFSFREREGLSVVLEETEAESRELPCQYPCKLITLSVRSSLAAVGLLAEVTAELARHGISANAASAYFHDHLFVPAERAEEAVTLLTRLASPDNEKRSGLPLVAHARERRVAAPLVFLPGAGGRASFWAPVAARLADLGPARIFAWPGFGEADDDASIRRLSDLIPWVAVRWPPGRCTLIAQSMGGVVALELALAFPERVEQLVLTATSGGLDLTRLGAKDWRPEYRRDTPAAPPWFIDDRTDLTGKLSSLRCKCLLIWGDADPVSPVAVGQTLERLIPGAQLVVLPGGTHAFAEERADETAALLRSFLEA